MNCERGQQTLFTDLSFSLAAGEVLQIEGGNGTGKTTLLKILAGVLEPCGGQVSWLQEIIPSRLYIGYQTAVKAELTAMENLAWWVALDKGIAITPAQCFAALDEVMLSAVADAPCRALSAGQCRRLQLARLRFSDAKVWLLDEPFTALDQAAVECLEQLVADHSAAGGAVIFTSHQSVSVDSRRVLLTSSRPS